VLSPHRQVNVSVCKHRQLSQRMKDATLRSGR